MPQAGKVISRSTDAHEPSSLDERLPCRGLGDGAVPQGRSALSSSRAAGDRNPSPKPKAPDAPVGVSEGDARIFFWRPKLGGVLPECVHPYFSGCSGSVDAPEIRREGPNCAGAAEWRESALPCRGATECSVIVSRGTGCPSSPGAIGGKCLYLSVCCRGGYSASWLLIRRQPHL